MAAEGVGDGARKGRDHKESYKSSKKLSGKEFNNDGKANDCEQAFGGRQKRFTDSVPQRLLIISDV